MENMTMPNETEMPKRLSRDMNNRVFGGVASGLANYFAIDPVLIRILFIITAFSGFGILAYILLWIFMPVSTHSSVVAGEPKLNAQSTSYVHRFLGVGLMLIGGYWLMDNLEFYWFDSFIESVEDFAFPSLLILSGLGVLYFSLRKPKEDFEMAQTEEPRRLFRVMKERMIAGVCSGLGYYFKVDPVLVRILFVISVFVSFGATLLVYLILALVVPKDNGL